MLALLLILAGIWGALVVIVLALCVASSHSDADLEAAYRQATAEEVGPARLRVVGRLSS